MNLQAIALATVTEVVADGVKLHFLGEISARAKVYRVIGASPSVDDRVAVAAVSGTYVVLGGGAGGGSGSVAMTDLTDVDGTDTPAKNDVVKFNGTKFVFVPEGTDFEFSIATFSTNAGSSPVLIGTGVWKAAGAITFTGAYNNGPPSSAYVALSGWSNLAMGGTGLVTAVSAEAVNYPSVGGTRVFTLNATDGTDSDTKSVTVAFYNKRFWGVSTKAESFTEADVEGLTNEISNSKGRTFSVTPGADQYIVYAYPKRLGTVVFTVGGFEGGFEAPETVSVTNSAGYTEDYYVYRSTNANLGATTVVAS